MIKHLFINHSLMKEKGFWGFGVMSLTCWELPCLSLDLASSLRPLFLQRLNYSARTWDLLWGLSLSRPSRIVLVKKAKSLFVCDCICPCVGGCPWVAIC